MRPERAASAPAARTTSITGGAPAAARSVNLDPLSRSIVSHSARTSMGGVTTKCRVRRHCLLAACATRPHRPSRPLGARSASSPRLLRPPPRFPPPSLSPPPIVPLRVVNSGTNARAPNSAHFSTSQSPRPPFNPPNALTTSQSAPLPSASSTISSTSTVATAPETSTSLPYPRPPTPSHTSRASPTRNRSALTACLVSSRLSATAAPAPSGPST